MNYIKLYGDVGSLPDCVYNSVITSPNCEGQYKQWGATKAG